jgi:K+-sensing histidine kinase KdpD
MAHRASRGSVLGEFLRRIGLTLLSVGLAFLFTLLLQPLFPYPFLFVFFGGVMSSAWFGGAAAGLFAVLLSTMLVDYFFVPPHIRFRLARRLRLTSRHSFCVLWPKAG